MESLSGTVVINQERKSFPTEKVIADAKLIVILFSASWCNEAAGFINKIRKVYEVLLVRGGIFLLISIV